VAKTEKLYLRFHEHLVRRISEIPCSEIYDRIAEQGTVDCDLLRDLIETTLYYQESLGHSVMQREELESYKTLLVEGEPQRCEKLSQLEVLWIVTTCETLNSEGATICGLRPFRPQPQFLGGKPLRWPADPIAVVKPPPGFETSETDHTRGLYL
jgi:hypothetical protein